MSIASSVRRPRRSHGTSMIWKSSGQGLTPTPRRRRLPVRYATDAACLATSTGGRTGSLSTKVVNRSVLVAAPSAIARIIASMNGLFSRNSRLPSGVYG